MREVGGDKFSYASDYEIVTKLKAFSDKYGICFLVVHHTRKMESSDSFDMISGTNGLLGAADGAFVMQKEKRTDNKAVLEVAGRDQQDQKLWLNFNRERCVWELTKTETELWRTRRSSVGKNQRTCNRNYARVGRNSNRACGSIADGNAAERIITKIKCQPGTIDSGIWNPV